MKSSNLLKQLVFSSALVFMIGYCGEPGLVPLADQCICPGYTLQLKCTIVGRGTTIWNVNGEELSLRHDDDFSVDSRSRNGIEARGLSSDDNCYMSLLTILISPDLNGVNVTCQYDDGIMNIFTVGVYSIQLTTGLEPFSPPNYINLTNISIEGLTFEWTGVSPNCSAVSYSISSVGCGNCPLSTNSISVVCHGVQLDGENRSCTFRIRAVTCGDIMGNVSNPLTIQLEAASIPKVQFLPKYWQNTTGSTCLVSFITEIKINEQDLHSISGNNIDVLSYIVNYQTDGRSISGSELSHDACNRNVCRVEVELMMPSCLDIIVMVSGKSVLGTGPASLSKIDGNSNSFVTIAVNNNNIICTFKNQQDASMKTCIVEYGQCGASLNQTARGSSTSESTYRIEIQLDSELTSYCYSVSASNDTYAVLVEGNVTNGPPQGMDAQLESGAIAGIVIGIFIVLCLCVTIPCIGLVLIWCIKNRGSFSVKNRPYVDDMPMTRIGSSSSKTDAGTQTQMQAESSDREVTSHSEVDEGGELQDQSPGPKVGEAGEGEEAPDSNFKKVCKLDGCDRPVYLEKGGGKPYDFCGITHAREWHQENDPPVPVELQCAAPNCKIKKHPRPENEGGGFYDYCSITCRDEARGRGTCLRPGCNNSKYHDSNKTYDYCSRTCGRKAKEQGLPPHKITQLTNLRELSTISLQFEQDWKKGACPDVKFVYEVSNSSLETKWKAYREKLEDQIEERHYHGTKLTCDMSNMPCTDKECGICGISKNGFDQQLFETNCQFQRFGPGIYLAPNSSKCHDYTQGANGYRAMLRCEVYPGKKYKLQGNKTDLKGPPKGYDCVYGEPGRKLNYPEIVVYDPDAVLPRYIIVYRKDGICKLVE